MNDLFTLLFVWSSVWQTGSCIGTVTLFNGYLWFLQLSHGGNSTIQAPVDLSTFHALSQLDVKKIPPHWILGLDKFKDKLTLIRMSRSINFLEVRNLADDDLEYRFSSVHIGIGWFGLPDPLFTKCAKTVGPVAQTILHKPRSLTMDTQCCRMKYLVSLHLVSLPLRLCAYTLICGTWPVLYYGVYIRYE